MPILRLAIAPDTEEKKLSFLTRDLWDLIAYSELGKGAKGTFSNDWWRIVRIQENIPPNMAGRLWGYSVEMLPSYWHRNFDEMLWDDFNRADPVNALSGTPSCDNQSGPFTASGHKWYNAKNAGTIATVVCDDWDLITQAAQPNTDGEAIAVSEVFIG